jgi:hypothetical protein
MDPITIAVVAALPALATGAIKDAYEGLKAVIKRKWGEAAPIAEAVAALEKDPSSKAQASVLEEKVAAAKATEDSDVLQALHKLVEQMKTQGVGGGGVANIQFTMSGGLVQGIAGAGTANVGTMTFGTPPKS